MDSPGYEEIDHTADLALRVWGQNFEQLLTQSAKGLYSLMNITPSWGTRIGHHFFIKKDTKEVMLVDFLNELLYLCEDKKQGFDLFSFSENSDKLEVYAQGFRVDDIQVYIKAVTFHDLRIQNYSSGLVTTVTFDV